MTNRQYGISLALIMASIPAVVGVWSIIMGAIREMIGPVILGVIFLIIATIVYSSIYGIIKKQEKRE